MIFLDRVVAALGVGLAVFGAAVVTIAQGVLDPTLITIERLIGGGILLVAAVLIVRWTFQMLGEMRKTAREQQESHDADRKAWIEERGSIREERDDLRKLLIETRRQLDQERALRVSLEEKGIVDRRSP